ncbi:MULTISPECIES: hypothetical protein [Niastella]|uniref:Beta-lactamase-inhibitor-like PepSY-like domain-containing protein n=1 Tax=Niastella soli TaxID=2821487 RepID=A0ABS3YPW0_9BACT|nr:hypothetical protein [Niastella soli]MBO9199923.1 hypothetical protein [Niastella soli]
MKNVLVTTSIAVVLIIGSATAQQVNRPIVAEGMQSLQMNTRNVSKVHVRAMRDFLKRDKTVANVDWMIVETGYVAKYTDANNSNCRTVYNNRGDFVYTIRQYYENKLPRDIRGMVKSVYYDYAITLVEQIEETRKPLVYVVHLEDATTFMNVRVSEKEMEIMAEYIKSTL